ncbi:MAG: HsdM family class I SAM-dependent methyltransferase [Thermoleophilaceae bacterium]
MNPGNTEEATLDRLRAVLDRPAGRYRQLNGATNLGDYLSRQRPREDEELLTEPVLEDLMERLLGFPADAYFPQLGRSGLKPDFTPHDLVAHRYVLDAKSSTQDLATHEDQIRRYIDQRQLDYGVLFNLHEVRVYRRGEVGHVASLSPSLLALWHVARGEALPDEETIAPLLAFVARFAYRELGMGEKIDRIRTARSWTEREERGEMVEIDLDFLVDRLRDLSIELRDDAADQRETLERSLKLQPGREQALLRELELIALDLAPGLDLEELPKTVEGYLEAGDLAGRVWWQYLLRVSQLALTRILLYRSWEDVEFVDSYLYDGGFQQWYDRLDRDLQRVLREAFAHGRERYHWLYGSDNNYDWYRPRDEALVDVLYALLPVPLGKLDADVLGGLYESYVDEIDRDRLGQFYTPRAVVRFMLDRAGFDHPEAIFRIEGDRREPRRLLDFATGSGGFLVEAARRVIDRGGLDLTDRRDLDDGLAAIARGFHGLEISPFPYYLTEVNLLLQVSRLLGAMRLAGIDAPPFVLGVAHADSLSARHAPDKSFEGIGAESRLDRGELMRDERFGLVPLDREKQEAFERMHEDDSFDLVIGNPPYVFETGNRVLFERLRGLPAWREDYRGKSDYLYYFLALAAEKVAADGRLCVITPAGWMNAGKAEWLRERLAGTLRLDELFLFGSHRLFAPERDQRRDRRRAPVPTVESAILVATKAAAPAGHELRVVALEDEAAAARALSGNDAARVPGRDMLLAEMAARAGARAGRRNGIHVHRLPQVKLQAAYPWPIKHGARDVAAQVVAHLDQMLADDNASVEPLGERWRVFQGVQTGADAYTARIQKRLPVNTKRRLESDGARTGDRIMELPPGSENRPPWQSHRELLARSPESRAILYGAIDASDYGNLVWIGREDEVPEPIVAELEPWRAVLSTRAEFARNAKRRWFETAWSRDKAQLRSPKVIALYRTDRGRFALDEEGEWQPSIKATVCVGKAGGLSVAYLCGLLNSELLDLWYAIRGKSPRDVWRNYEPRPMLRMPYRHVEFASEVSSRLRELEKLLAAGDVAAAAGLTDELGQELRDEPSSAGEAAGALERLVREVAANRTALLPHRDVVPELSAAVKDPWRTGPLSVDARRLVTSIASVETVSVRLDSSLRVEMGTDGTLGSFRWEGSDLVFRRSRQVTARVTGAPERLRQVEMAVGGNKRLLPDDLLRLPLPRDAEVFASTVAAREAEVHGLMDHGRLLVEAAERIVCRLYRVPPDLEDAVIDHAHRRAASRSTSETEPEA